MKPKLIDTETELDNFVTSFQPKDIISLDTEFVRRDTYYAKLSLMQLGLDSGIFIFDALKLDLQILWDNIINSGAKIIIHSGRQDLEIFYRLFGSLPSNIIDTQIAAKYCGFRASASYGELCKEICNVEIDKTHQSGDWLERDLPESKIEYAAIDVTHLKEIYLYLQNIIDKQSLHDIVDTSVKSELLDESLYKNDFALAWKKVKFPNKRKHFVNKMVQIAAFREESASILDIPKRFFATDGQLIQLCYILPQDDKSLRRIKGLRKWILRPEYKQKLYDLCKEIADERELV